MNQAELRSLLEKYVNGNCSPEETVLLESWYLSKSKKDKMPPIQEVELTFYKELIWEDIEEKANIKSKPTGGRYFGSWSFISVAASLALVLSFGGYYLFKEQISPKNPEVAQIKQDVLPGRNKAVLVLSNGKEVNLEDVQSGVVAKEGGITVQKNGINILSYKQQGVLKNEGSTAYNTIRTPNAGQWPVIELPDGTKAFLDAASSISFPVAFNKERKVTITGQVYFQVVHDSKKPFRVAVKGMIIEDLGTDFNVNAYDDESSVKTTLVEGSVSVAKKDQKIILKPGQQAVSTSGNDKIISKEANIEEVIAWKNGLFQFSHTSIDVVMRQLARWYDVDIVYKEDVSKLSFTGNLPRNLKLSRLLEMLSVTGLHFKIEGKQIIITP
ncbi:FecR family protein [Pedobacter nototheniae]|uniref:FecR family protein n=1 Tax=Pedobacter nototheniae TaxID=2488994 RepID=UPI002930833E|nr:FecR domain-containing protein [Pedobacter nototheniae]